MPHLFSSRQIAPGAFRSFLLFVLAVAACTLRAQSIPRLPGIIGQAPGMKATLAVSEGPHRGTYTLAKDIKGLVLYPGAHIVAIDAAISSHTIDFQKFEWERLEDIMLANADILPGWELPGRFTTREIPASALARLPNLVPHTQVPVRGIAQRVMVKLGDEPHAYQIRYYEFQSPSAAAMFAERWSAKKGVLRDTTEHFRRSFDKTAVWIVNVDDERLRPDYWTARFMLESLSRKALITLDTSIIFNRKNADAVVFNAEPDTVGPGDKLVLIGQGFSPFKRDNIVAAANDQDHPFQVLSSTSHQITVEIPRELPMTGPTMDLPISVVVRRYALTNEVVAHIRK